MLHALMTDVQTALRLLPPVTFTPHTGASKPGLLWAGGGVRPGIGCVCGQTRPDALSGAREYTAAGRLHACVPQLHVADVAGCRLRRKTEGTPCSRVSLAATCYGMRARVRPRRVWPQRVSRDCAGRLRYLTRYAGCRRPYVRMGAE